MRIRSKLAAIAGTLALAAVPGVALGAAGGHSSHSGTQTTGAGKPSKAEAYGKLCQGESKQHVAGTPGTPFSKCVTDMAKVAKSPKTNPAKACKDESKKHVAGQRGTPFSVCVSAAKKLQGQQSGA